MNEIDSALKILRNLVEVTDIADAKFGEMDTELKLERDFQELFRAIGEGYSI